MKSDYLKFRGKCKKMCEDLIEKDSSLKLVRGHYYCPIWNSNEQHWWVINSNGDIVDPTKDQFPSKGNGFYEEFNGVYQCSECGKDILEEEADFESNYVFCSYQCHGRFVGVF